MSGPLEALLAVMSHGEALSLESLAYKIDATPGLVQQMLDHLTSAGYLSALDPSCRGSRAGCGEMAACRSISFRRVWVVTERGRLLQF